MDAANFMNEQKGKFFNLICSGVNIDEKWKEPSL